MELTIHGLDAGRMKDFLHFFDNTAFTDNPDWSGCYCTFYHRTVPVSEWASHSGVENRAAAVGLIARGEMKGYLAYEGAEPVGWCNANVKTAYPAIAEDPELKSPEDARIVSIVCFVVRPDRRRTGVSSRLLEAVIQGARETEGIDFVEAYPVKEADTAAKNYHGHPVLYSRAGFGITAETERLLIVRLPV